MSQRANPALIGAFVVGAAVLIVAALLLWGGTSLFRTKLDYVLYFDSAVTGLQKGAPVMFRGVRIGEVNDVQIRWGTTLVAVYISLEPQLMKGTPPTNLPERVDEAVQRGLRAQLRTQSLLTGVLFVALDSVPDSPIVLRAPPGSKPRELPTIPTDREVWLAKLETIADKIGALPLDEVVQAASTTLNETTRLLRSPEITRVLKSTEQLMVDTRRLIQKVDTLAANVNAQIDPIAGDARATLKSAQVALADVPKLVDDVRSVAKKVDVNVEPLLTSLTKASDVAQAALEQARVTLEHARTTLEQATVTMRGVDGFLDQDSPLGYELAHTLRDLSEAARALRSLADYLERVPDSVVYGVRRTRDGR
jgi:paraquat-inducible protein B